MLFETIGEYFLFVIPCTILLALGIVFEEKLVDFENLLLANTKALIIKISKGVKKAYATAYGKI